MYLDTRILFCLSLTNRTKTYHLIFFKSKLTIGNFYCHVNFFKRKTYFQKYFFKRKLINLKIYKRYFFPTTLFF